jgi:hypothetical protein
MGSREAPPRGRTVRTGVQVGLAVLGLIVALIASRRRRPAHPSPAPAPDAEPAASPAVNVSAASAAGNAAPPADAKADSADRPIRPGLFGLGALAIAVLFTVGTILAYNLLNHWYRSAELTVTTNNPSSGQQVTLGGSGGPAVRWTLDGYVGQLTVGGLGSTVVMLPVPVSQCRAVTASLGVPCTAQGIPLSPPAEFSWSTAQLLSSQSNGESAPTLELEPSAAGLAQSLTMSVTNASPVLCFVPLNSATLTITEGRRHYTQVFPGFTRCDGLAATVGTQGPAAPSFELAGVEGLTVTASGPTVTLQGFSSQITLNPGGTSVQGPATVVSLGAAGRQLSVTLQVAPGTPALTVPDQPATSVMADGSQLVPSEWSRETDVFGPVLGGVVTALIVTPLGLSLGVFTDALKRWPGPRRRVKKETDSS